MISKEVFRKAVDLVVARSGRNQEELATGIGYGKNYISEVLSPTGKISPKFFKAFEKQYAEYLENPNRRLPKENSPKMDIDALLVSLMEKQNSLMSMQNSLLSEMKEEVKDKIKRIDLNLNTALGGVSQLSLHVESAKTVIMESLARLEKKPKGSLTGEADKIVERLMQERKKPGSNFDGGMQSNRA